MTRLARFLGIVVAGFVLAVAGCAPDGGANGTGYGSGGNESETENEAENGGESQRFPDVVDVTVQPSGETFSFDVTITSPYDSPERYADGWRVKGPDGTVYGEHELLHDHAGEQPFTRTQTGVSIPEGVSEVVVEGRDQRNGYGGATKNVRLPGR